jgi:hyperosmotically inducible protein
MSSISRFVRTLAPAVALACLASLAFPGCGGSMRSMSAGPTVNDDATITARVKTVLLNDQQVAATNIAVSTVNGVVTMSGSVKSNADATRAIELARQTPGVKDVVSTLKVQN